MSSTTKTDAGTAGITADAGRRFSGLIFYVPENVATTPAEGHCFVNRWWTVHPEHGVAFYCSRMRLVGLDPGEQDEPSPQCNSDEYTSRELSRRNHPSCVVKLIPAVFLGPAIKEMHKQRAALKSSGAS